jgi:hypothetical protein
MSLFTGKPAYPWSLPIAQQLHLVLCQAYDSAPVAVALAQNAGIPKHTVNWNGAMKEVWGDLLEQAVRQAKIDALLDRVRADPRGAPAAAVIALLEVGGGPAVNGLACDTLILPGDKPFLDRRKLREALRRMQANGGSVSPILLVRGPPQSGKTSTRELVSVIAGALGDGVVFLHETVSTDVNAAAKYLLFRLGAKGGSLPARNTTEAAWYREVALDVVALAEATKRRWWIVVDDLGFDASGQPRLDREVLAFFHQFALLLLDPGVREHLRLVLLDYPDAPNHPPTKIGSALIEQDLIASNATEEDVREFVRTFLEYRHLKFAEADVDKYAAAVLANVKQLAGAGASPPSYMGALYDELVEWMRGITP